MDIYTIRDNLKQTIEGKEKFLASLNESAKMMVGFGLDQALANQAARKFIEINLTELRLILKDVELCIAEQAEVFVP